MTSGILFDIKKYAIHDGPGIRTTLFLKSCPLRCRWCHNPESQSARPQVILRPQRCQICGACMDACPHGAIAWSENGPLTDRAVCEQCGQCTTVCYAEARQLVGREMNSNEVMREVLADLPFYETSGGGVTLSGGEPLLQPDFCLEILQACRQHEIHTAVDTCGQVPWETFEQVLPCVDLFLYDLKLADPDLHRQHTGVSNERILSNLRELSQRGAPVLVRIPLVPGVNLEAEELQRMGALLAGLASPPPVELLSYHHMAGAKYAGLGREDDLQGVDPPTADQVQAGREILQGYGLEVRG